MTSQTVITRRLDNRDGLFGSANSLATFPGVHPYASHFRFDLAAAVLPDATTGTIAQRLGAIHRAGHAGFTQCALTAGFMCVEVVDVVEYPGDFSGVIHHYDPS